MKAIITAGSGNHLRPLTHTKNKHLLELANKPLIFYAIEKVASAGIKEIGIIVKEGDSEIQKRIGDGYNWGVKITYIPQLGGAKGLAHAVYSAQTFLGEDSFMLYLGDNIIHDDLEELKIIFEQGNLNCLLALTKIPNPEKFGVPVFDKDGRILKVEERPIEPKSPYAVAGVYFYDNNVHKAFPHLKPSFRGSYEISDLHTWLAENGYNVHYQEIKNWWKDRGSPTDLLEGNIMILSNIESENLGKIEKSVSIQGRVKIGQDTKIGGKTTIRGPVVIGNNCLIKDSFIGPYTSIGNKSELHNAHIEHSIVYENSSITTSRSITDSLIGENSIISNAEHETPRGARLIISENSSLSL